MCICRRRRDRTGPPFGDGAFIAKGSLCVLSVKDNRGSRLSRRGVGGWSPILFASYHFHILLTDPSLDPTFNFFPLAGPLD